jgi:hypothetical protein
MGERFEEQCVYRNQVKQIPEKLKMDRNIFKLRKLIVMMIAAMSLFCFSAEIIIKDVQEILNNEGQLNGGFIQNLQVSPFNSELMSFEVSYDNDPTVKLFLFNIKTKNLFQVESTTLSGDTKGGKKKYYVKDKGLQWHPYKNWFVFYGNGFQNRDQIYVCRVVVPELINNFAVNGYRVGLKENPKEEKSYLKEPCFDMTGENIYFSRRVLKRDKKAKYNRSFNITVVSDLFKYRDNKFKNVEYKTVLDKRFDQVKPVCSPSDKELVAYISYKNQEKKGEDFYPQYSLNVVNTATSDIFEVDNMDGYSDYPFKWSNRGTYLYYFKALSLLRTPQKLIDEKVNQVNLQFAKITKAGNRITVLSQTNPKTDVLLDDVAAKENAIFFINDNNILLGKYDPYPSLYLLDVNMWRNSDKNYSQKLQFGKDFDSEYPVLIGNDLYFISSVWLKNKTIFSLQTSAVVLKLSAGESRDIAGVKAEIDASASEGDDYEEGGYSDDEYYDDGGSDEPDVPVAVVEPKKTEPKSDPNQGRILEMETKLSTLLLEKSKIDNLISAEQNNLETYENALRTQNRESAELADKKNSRLTALNDLRAQQTAKLQSLQVVTAKQSELNKLNTDKLTLQNEILKLENAMLTEKNQLGTLELSLSTNNAEIVKLNRKVSDLKIEKTKTLETGNKLASFETQLTDLRSKDASLKTEIETLTKQLTNDMAALKELENQKSLKDSQKQTIAASTEKLRTDKVMSLQKDKDSQISSRQAKITEYKNKLNDLDKQISDLLKLAETENSSLTAMRDSANRSNEQKTSVIAKLGDLKKQKADSVKETVVAKQEDPKKAEEPEKDEYEDDDYSDDGGVGDDVFEEVKPAQSSGRRGRR